VLPVLLCEIGEGKGKAKEKEEAGGIRGRDRFMSIAGVEKVGSRRSRQ
jgi:hypothetical protein